MNESDSQPGPADDDAAAASNPTPIRQDTQTDASGGHAPTMALSSASLVGTQLAGYQVLRRLGRGGMADVFAARDMDLERDVAIKVLRRDLARDRDYIARFRREAKAAAKLNHTNIVQIYEVGEDNARYYIAQELVDGVNLREWLERNGTLDAEQAVVVLFGVASALDAAASQGITHRDIKPENVMWSKFGTIKVADFGLARLGDGEGSRADLTQAGLTLGTPRYMSPEQVQGHPVDPRSDLYSLGVTMYHLLAGRPPFEADDPLALAFAHVNEFPEPIDRVRGEKDIPEWLIAIVSKLLRKDPGERFQTPSELLDTLTGDEKSPRNETRRLVGAATATARLQRVADEQKRRQFRSRIQSIVVAIIPLLFLGLGAAAVNRTRRASVENLLRPDEVERKETVEEQFLHAVRRNDPAAWLAVSEYFPPEEGATNQSYASKASLQLARQHEIQNRRDQGLAVLDELLDDPGTADRFRLVAWAWKIRMLQGLSRPTAEDKRKLENLHNELETRNSEAIRWFNRVVPPAEQVSLGLSTTEDE